MDEEVEQAVEQVEQVEQAQEVAHEDAQPEPKSNRVVDQNWQQARMVMEAQKSQIEALERQIKELGTKQAPPAPEPDEFADLDPSDYVTVEKAKQLAKNLAAKEAKQTAQAIVQEYLQKETMQRRLDESEREAKSKYEDYDYVLNTYALPAIKQDPALAHKVFTSKNPALTAYKIGKMELDESMDEKPTNPKAERILKNASRPVSGNAVSAPLKDQANQFSKMSKDQIWEQSQKYARSA